MRRVYITITSGNQCLFALSVKKKLTHTHTLPSLYIVSMFWWMGCESTCHLLSLLFWSTTTTRIKQQGERNGEEKTFYTEIQKLTFLSLSLTRSLAVSLSVWFCVTPTFFSDFLLATFQYGGKDFFLFYFYLISIVLWFSLISLWFLFSLVIDFSYSWDFCFLNFNQNEDSMNCNSKSPDSSNDDFILSRENEKIFTNPRLK